MEAVIKHVESLSPIVQESKSKSKKLVRKLSDADIVVLIELFLNYDKLGQCTEPVNKQVKNLQNIKWKIKTAREQIIKNLDSVRLVLGLAILITIQKEIFDICKL